ncbi:hypothetical protein MVEN_02147900 [Mycena venus]|uniref:Protein kinase domain-containing protein n=1 Tax=Mycena venus TaxID=2733690 RepID=A0A8H6X9S5_9AGAR|nr:hypothetical protein MVEN_02147900 [Mycena venus]
MDDIPEESPAQSNPGVFGDNSHAALVNNSSGAINMFGCTTTSNFTFTSAAAVPSDFQMIPVGDIDLQHEIRLDSFTGAVERRREHTRSRRLHSAKIEGRKSPVTVAIYQGDGAKESVEEWQQDIVKYMSARHPNIIQIYAAASSKNIHATVFYDDLVPFRDFVDLYYCHSPILTVYMHACGYSEFEAVSDYLRSAFQHELDSVECTFLIRRSTGRLCVDLMHVPGSIWLFPYSHPYIRSVETVRQQGCQSLNTPDQQAMVSESLTLEQYHSICRWDLRQYQIFTISASSTVNLGAVMSYPPGNLYEDSVEIASLSDVFIHQDRWKISEKSIGEAMEDGWTRCISTDVLNKSIELMAWSPHVEVWLSQANHILSCLDISSNFYDYVVLNRICFELTISAAVTDLPKGFLFLCQAGDFRTGPSSFSWPDCPAYWSLDPSGTERLGMEHALHLGFPSIQFLTTIWGSFWDDSVYDGLCQFHQGKGFDPKSQDVARHLGHPLYHISSHLDAVHDEESSGSEDWDSNVEFRDAQNTSSEIEVYNSAVSGPQFPKAKRPNPESHEVTRLLEYRLCQHSNQHAVDNEESSGIEDWDSDTELKGARTSGSKIELPEPKTGGKEAECPNIHEGAAISQAFKLVMNVQLSLILFLAVCWLYCQL